MLPLQKGLLVGFRMLSRPINNSLKVVFTHRFLFMRRFMIHCGQYSHRFELFINRKITNQDSKLDVYIKPLSDEAAFNKGIDYVIEAVFLYGVLIVLSLWEIQRTQSASEL
jgi:hypothetical protein